MRKQFLSITIALLVVTGVAAQDIPKEEVYGGYTFLRFNPNGPINSFTANGGIGSFQYNFNSHIGLVAELGGVHNGQLTIGSTGVIQPDQTAFTYLFGPRIFFNKRGVVSPFFEGLAGGFHNSRSFFVPSGLPSGSTKFSSTQTAAAVAIGGGIDIRLSRLISVRPIQLDYVPTNFSPFNVPGLGKINSSSWQQNLRYSAGLAFRFGAPPPPIPRASCSATPAELLPWDGPVSASVQVADFNPDHKLTYNWASTSGVVGGEGTSTQVDTTRLTPGNYTITATVSDPKQKKFANAASCTASFTVKQPQPPVVGCSVTPTTVHPGDPVTITAQSSSPDSSKIANRNFSASAGSVKEGETTTGNQPGQSSTVATLDTSGIQPGPVSVTIGVTDVHGLTGTCVASANVEALPIAVVSERLISECSFRNERKLARVDNECKAILDEAALELQHEPNGRLVVVGYAEEEEEIKVTDVESLRSVNAKSYLTGGEAKQQIDPTRVEARKSSDRGNGKSAKLYFVPEGGTFTVQNTIVVDESSLPADRTGAPKKQKAAQPASSAISGQ